MSNRTLLAIGTVVKAFGLHGDVVILPMTEQPARFKKLKSVFVGRTAEQSGEVRVTHVAVEKRGVRLRLENIADRTSAEKLVGAVLFVDEKNAIRPSRGSYFVHDVVGLKVVDEEGNAIGVVSDVLKFPANDVYVVEYDGKEVLLPAVKEFIRKIELETKTMSVRLIEGMLGETGDEVDDHDAD